MLGFLAAKVAAPVGPTPPKWIDWATSSASQESTQPNDDVTDSSDAAPSDFPADTDDSDEWSPFAPRPKRIRRVITDSEDDTVDYVAEKARLAYLVGRTVAKPFAGGIIFRGAVVRVDWVESTQTHMLFIRYSDGDTEHMSEKDVLEFEPNDYFDM